jgi:hypothetical protein
MDRKRIPAFLLTAALAALGCAGCADSGATDQNSPVPEPQSSGPRTRVLINGHWRFTRGDPPDTAVSLLYDVRPAAGRGDGRDLSFVTLTVADNSGQMVPRSMNSIDFAITGPREIVATDNGDPTNTTPFPSKTRKAFNGLALMIVRAKPGQRGNIVVTAKADGLQAARATIAAR